MQFHIPISFVYSGYSINVTMYHWRNLVRIESKASREDDSCELSILEILLMRWISLISRSFIVENVWNFSSWYSRGNIGNIAQYEMKWDMISPDRIRMEGIYRLFDTFHQQFYIRVIYFRKWLMRSQLEENSYHLRSKMK